MLSGSGVHFRTAVLKNDTLAHCSCFFLFFFPKVSGYFMQSKFCSECHCACSSWCGPCSAETPGNKRFVLQSPGGPDSALFLSPVSVYPLASSYRKFCMLQKCETFVIFKNYLHG